MSISHAECMRPFQNAAMMTWGRCSIYNYIFSIKSVHLWLDKGRSELAIVLWWSRADTNQACVAFFLQRDAQACTDFLGFTDRSRARSYKTCAELHKPTYFCTCCCWTFSTRGSLWCLLKISNSGIVLAKYIIIPVCSEVLLYSCYLPPFRCKQGSWWLAKPSDFCIFRPAFSSFSVLIESLVWPQDL